MGLLNFHPNSDAHAACCHGIRSKLGKGTLKCATLSMEERLRTTRENLCSEAELPPFGRNLPVELIFRSSSGTTNQSDTILIITHSL